MAGVEGRGRWAEEKNSVRCNVGLICRTPTNAPSWKGSLGVGGGGGGSTRQMRHLLVTVRHICSLQIEGVSARVGKTGKYRVADQTQGLAECLLQDVNFIVSLLILMKLQKIVNFCFLPFILISALLWSQYPSFNNSKTLNASLSCCQLLMVRNINSLE